MISPIIRRRFPAKFAKDAVKLGKTIEAAGEGDAAHGVGAVEQQKLTVSHANKVNVVRECVAGDPAKLMREIVGTHAGFPRQLIEAQFLAVMGVDVVGDRVDLLGNLILDRFWVVEIALGKGA